MKCVWMVLRIIYNWTNPIWGTTRFNIRPFCNSYFMCMIQGFNKLSHPETQTQISPVNNNLVDVRRFKARSLLLPNQITWWLLRYEIYFGIKRKLKIQFHLFSRKQYILFIYLLLYYLYLAFANNKVLVNNNSNPQCTQVW